MKKVYYNDYHNQICIIDEKKPVQKIYVCKEYFTNVIMAAKVIFDNDRPTCVKLDNITLEYIGDL